MSYIRISEITIQNYRSFGNEIFPDNLNEFIKIPEITSPNASTSEINVQNTEISDEDIPF